LLQSAFICKNKRLEKNKINNFISKKLDFREVNKKIILLLIIF